MKKTINIHLCQQMFTLDEDACTLLEGYLENTHSYFKRKPDGEEIANDIENRVAELLSEYHNNGCICITRQQVEEIMARIGNPEELDMEGNDAASTDSEDINDKIPPIPEQKAQPKRRLFRDTDNALIGGVISGFCQYFGFKDVTIWRLAYVLLCFFSFSTLIIVYALLFFIVPTPKNAEERLQMRGEPINFQNINEELKKGTAYAEKKITNSKAQRILFNIAKVCFFILLFIISTPIIIILATLLIVALSWIVVIPFVLAGAIQSLTSIPILFAEASLLEGLPMGINVLFLIIAVIATAIILIPLILVIKLAVKPSHSISTEARVKLGLSWVIALMALITLVGVALYSYVILEETGAYEFSEERFEQNIRNTYARHSIPAEDSIALGIHQLPAIVTQTEDINLTITDAKTGNVYFVVNDSLCEISVEKDGKNQSLIKISNKATTVNVP